MQGELTWAQFGAVDMRVGTVLSAAYLEGARQPAIVLHIDMGPLGILKSSAQITHYYEPHGLVGQQVVAVVNFPPMQIAHIISQCLVLGAIGDGVTLLQPERPVPNGSKVA